MGTGFAFTAGETQFCADAQQESSVLPRIGLLSDSHGRAGTTARAVRLLIEQQVDLLLHLGDIGTLEVIDALIERLDAQGNPDPPVRLVFGNTDWDLNALARYAKQLGLIVDDPMGRLTFNDKTLVYQHGHHEAALAQALAEGVNYLCHGHTHRMRDERLGNTRVINPGALFRAAEYTVAVLDTESDNLVFLQVPQGALELP
jgi:putative phosphoesterase